MVFLVLLNGYLDSIDIRLTRGVISLGNLARIKNNNKRSQNGNDCQNYYQFN
jgi:hypothetical protein